MCQIHPTEKIGEMVVGFPGGSITFQVDGDKPLVTSVANWRQLAKEDIEQTSGLQDRLKGLSEAEKAWLMLWRKEAIMVSRHLCGQHDGIHVSCPICSGCWQIAMDDCSDSGSIPVES